MPPAIEKPKITKQPQPVSVKVGETATFTVEAAGEGLSYQWQIKAGKGGWDDITDANTSSYTTTAVVQNCDGFQYRCVVSNSAGSVNSDSATLTVDTTYPQPQSQHRIQIRNRRRIRIRIRSQSQPQRQHQPRLQPRHRKRQNRQTHPLHRKQQHRQRQPLRQLLHRFR